MDGNALALLHDDLVRNPYAVYRQFRDADPVHWSDAWGAWFLTRYQDVAAAKRDPRLRAGRVSDFSARLPADSRQDMSYIEGALGRWLLFMDPPEHTRLRSLISKAFTPQTIHRMEGAIQERIDTILQPIEGRRDMDVVQDLAVHLPVLTVADMLIGHSPDSVPFYNWSRHLATFLGSDALTVDLADRTERTLREMDAYFRGVIADRRRQVEDDLISNLAAVREGRDALEDDEIVSMCTVLFGAGHDTTAYLIGNGMLAVLQHPDARRKLLDEPARLESAVEEMLRYDSPSQITSRYAAEDVEIGGKIIRRGDFVNLVVGAANRDPEVFEHPDMFDVDRQDVRHLSFGKGIHFCVGAFLARLEARLSVGTLLRRWPSIQLSGRPERHPTIGFRGLKRLPVTLA